MHPHFTSHLQAQLFLKRQQKSGLVTKVCIFQTLGCETTAILAPAREVGQAATGGFVVLGKSRPVVFKGLRAALEEDDDTPLGPLREVHVLVTVCACVLPSVHCTCARVCLRVCTHNRGAFLLVHTCGLCPHTLTVKKCQKCSEMPLYFEHIFMNL